jgi:hypothetical protein
MNITNYDVLIEASADETFRLANETHVGNKRFEVFLNLHKESYSKANAQGRHDACDSIVETLIDIVCHKCVPNGRFLERMSNKDPVEGEDEWMELGEGNRARLRVHQALSMYDVRINKIFHGESVEATTVDEQDAALKRRRRGSYARLRRSISESMLNTGSIEPSSMNNAKISYDFKYPETSLHHKLSYDFTMINEEDIEDMDVVFSSASPELSSIPQNAGKARFEIMINMRTQGYVKSTSCEEQLSIVKDLVQMVKNHWKGRFLLHEQDSFRLLDDALEAQEYISRCLEKQTTHSSVPDTSEPLGKKSGIRRLSQGVQSLHLAAIQSLKLRKQKKAIADRMGMLKGRSESAITSSPEMRRGRFGL